MTREELISCPTYWREQYVNECWRLGIKPDKVIFLPASVDEEELEALAKSAPVDPGEVYKEGFRKAIGLQDEDLHEEA